MDHQGGRSVHRDIERECDMEGEMEELDARSTSTHKVGKKRSTVSSVKSSPAKAADLDVADVGAIVPAASAAVAHVAKKSKDNTPNGHDVSASQFVGSGVATLSHHVEARNSHRCGWTSYPNW